MITYPSTYGVFETRVTELCQLVHTHGGRVYVDGANMNALVGLAAPGQFGGDVSHLNLHKTFCIPTAVAALVLAPSAWSQTWLPYLPAHRSHRSRQRHSSGCGVGRAHWATLPCCPSAGCTSA
jgi:glycine dehydrogenase